MRAIVFAAAAFVPVLLAAPSAARAAPERPDALDFDNQPLEATLEHILGLRSERHMSRRAVRLEQGIGVEKAVSLVR